MKIKTSLCESCMEKMNKLYRIHKANDASDCARHCCLCSFYGFINTYEYDTRDTRWEENNNASDKPMPTVRG